jgi:WD40 repeat protein
MASGDSAGFIIIWETNITVKFKINSVSPVYSLAFSPLIDNRLLVSGDQDSQIKLWDPSTSAQVGTLTGHGSVVSSLAFNRNGLLASGSWDDTVRLWNVTTKAEYKKLTGHTMDVEAVAFRSDGLLASGSFDTKVRIWS